mgnify:CR=1 FL=1|nr:MAG TPA: Putative zinc ribbon domain [Caudoviricetes sp.]
MQVELNAAGEPLSLFERMVKAVPEQVAAWGGDWDYAYTRYYHCSASSDIRSTIHSRMWSDFSYQERSTRYYETADFFGRRAYISDFMCFLMALYDPMVSKEHPDQIAIYANKRDYDREPKKRTTLKPHRFIRKVMPWLTEAEVEKYGDLIRESHIVDTTGFTLKCSDSAKAFCRAYSHQQAPYQNPHTTRSRKSLASSCMRYSEEDKELPYHPAEAYASGDFWMVYLEDAQGRIAGRCVVRKDPCCAGPVYGVNEQAIDMIEEYIEKELEGSLNAFTSDQWEGARLKALPHRGGYLAPYLDCYPQRLDSRQDDGFLVISHHGDIEADNYNGVLYSGGRYSCECCGENLDGDDVYSPPHGDTYCSDCFHDRYFTSDRSGGVFSRDDLVRVNVGSPWSSTATYEEDWSQDEAENYATYCEGPEEWFQDDLVTYDYNGDPITLKEAENDYFRCALDAELYPLDMAVRLDGETVSSIHVDESIHTYNGTSGEWETRDAA